MLCHVALKLTVQSGFDYFLAVTEINSHLGEGRKIKEKLKPNEGHFAE